MPSLAAVMGGQIVADIARAVGGAGGFNDQQALVRLIDVHYPHGVFVILLAVLVRENTLGIGRLQLEDHMAGMTVDTRLPVRAGQGWAQFW